MLRKAVSVLLTLLLSIVCAPAQALTEADLRTVVLENHAYVLGESTLAHFVQDGRSSYTIEADGTVRLPYQNGCLYLQLLDSSANPLSQPVVAMDLQWADGLSYAYCGISQEDTWQAVQSLFTAYETEEGDLIAEAKLDANRAVYVETRGTRLSLFYYDAALLGASQTESLADDAIGLRPTEAQSVQFSLYTQPEGLFTMQIPNGWQVSPGGDYISYIIDLYDPVHPQRELFIQLCGVGFQSAESAALAQNYNLMGSQLYVMPTPTTQGYFEGWYGSLGGSFTLIENLGSVGGGDLLHATATLQGVETEGVYTAKVYALNYHIGIDLSMTLGEGVMALTAAPGELPEWLPVLESCADSLRFSDAFWQAQQANWQQVFQDSAMISSTWNQISGMVLSSWSARSASYDRIMQAQSDATLGYDRFVDTQTGKTYRAEQGLMDGYDGQRFEKLETTSDLYGQSLSGYLYRK